MFASVKSKVVFSLIALSIVGLLSITYYLEYTPSTLKYNSKTIA